MDRKREKNTDTNKAVGKSGKSLPIARHGITNGWDFANLMSALMSDVIDDKVSPAKANAVCNVGGKWLKVIEMQLKYGRPGQNGEKTLALSAAN